VVGVNGAAAACGTGGAVCAWGREAKGACEEEDVCGFAEPLGSTGGAVILQKFT
jgi:hypothetical protein